MSVFYKKNNIGEYIPVEFKSICTKEWKNKLVLIRVGTDALPAPDSEVDETYAALGDCDALRDLGEASFLVSTHHLDFDVLGSINELGKQYISIRVTSDNDLHKIGPLKQFIKKQLQGKVKKVIMIPSPLTVDEYVELSEIKKRCDNRRNRRSGTY